MPTPDRLSRHDPAADALRDVPEPAELVRADGPSSACAATVLRGTVVPGFQGMHLLGAICRSPSGSRVRISECVPYDKDLRDLEFTDLSTGEPFRFPVRSLFDFWAADYDFARARESMLREAARSGKRPSVAFTVIDSAAMGGGTKVVFRFADWLAALGVDVAVYSNDRPPDGKRPDVRFHCIEGSAERYKAITESVVIAYSALELPHLLRHGDVSGRAVYHLCQGVEEFHYGDTSPESFPVRKPVFDLFHSLPVGRLAISDHVADHFRRNFRQRSLLIPNGIDTNVFRPRRMRPVRGEISVLFVGNPDHPLKGAVHVRCALLRLVKRRPEWRFVLRIASGNRISPRYENDLSLLGVTVVNLAGLSPAEMRDLYHSADLYVNAGMYEGFGMPSLEAMACGVPVVQADNQGLSGIAEDGTNCLLVPPGDPERMADAIEALVTDDRIRDRLVRNGIETAARYSVRSQFDAVVGAFEEILGRAFDASAVDAEKTELEGAGMDLRTGERKERRGPMFSVLVPTYNQARYLPAALDSLLAQTCSDWEAIVVNDGSTDDTPLVMEKYAARDRRIRLFHKRNGGTGSALNEGVRHARGEWICWLSSDDLFEPEKLSVHVAAIRETPEIRFFHTHYSLLYDETGEKAQPWPQMREEMPAPEAQVLNFFSVNYVHGNTIAVHRSVFEEVGTFDETLRCGQDFDMWLRMSAAVPLRYIDVRSCITRIHKGQGTTISPEKGIYDSTRSCIEFLNRRTFRDLFPLLSLDREADALKAIGETFRVAVRPYAFLYRCGYTTALLDRLCEWLTSECPASLCARLARKIDAMVQAVIGSPLPQEIKVLFTTLDGRLRSPFRYVPHDFEAEATAHVEALARNGKPEEAAVLRGYLEGFGAPARPAPVAEASGSGFDGNDTGRSEQPGSFRVVAIISAHNEGDVIFHVIGDLVRQGIDVYLLDNASTDDTAAEASRWLGKGLLAIERFPQDSGYPEENRSRFILHQIMRRKEELAATLSADWFINHDADEFREAPWPGLSLKEGLWVVDRLGYTAVDFELLNFRPVDDAFVPGTDVREALRYYEGCESFDAVQVRAWKNPGVPVSLAPTGGHRAEFEGRRVFPVKFLLRHYPVRSQAHGEKKVFGERKDRFSEEERRIGWHIQYDGISPDRPRFLHDPSRLVAYDGPSVKLGLLSREAVEIAASLPGRAAANDGIGEASGDGPAGRAAEGRALMKEQRFGEALAAFEEALAEGDRSVLAESGDCLAREGRTEEARTRYAEVLRANPADGRALVGMGVLAIVNGDCANASPWFEQVLAREPTNPQALCGMGLVCNAEGRAEEGFACFSNAFQADPTNVTVLHEITKAAYETGKLAEGEEALRTYLLYAPADVPILFSLAGLLYRRGSRAEAADVLDRIAALSPGYEGMAELREKIEEERR